MNHKMALHRCALLPRKNSGRKQLSQVWRVLQKLSLMTSSQRICLFLFLPPQTILRAHGLCSDLLHSSTTNATQTPDILCPVKRTKRSYQFRQLEQSKLTKKFQFFIAMISLEIIIGIASAPHA